MIFIGERINTGFKAIKEAVINRDGDVIKETAIKQQKAGADYLDVNLGAVSAKPEDLCWMMNRFRTPLTCPFQLILIKF